jgi:alkylresorcinol/alkylpyrone synthase
VEILAAARRPFLASHDLASASVLHVLRNTIAKRPAAGSPGVLMAVDSGFCSEIVLLRWW